MYSFALIAAQSLNMKWKFKKNTRVIVEWEDIVADLHSEDEIEPCAAESVGWIESLTKRYIRLTTSRYLDDNKTADRIVIPIGCVKDVKEI
jgi:sporulation protein YlmC with PRC-barrel domain